MKHYTIFTVLFLFFMVSYADAQTTRPTLTAGTFGVAWLDDAGMLRVYGANGISEPVPGVKMYAILAADLLDVGEDQLIYLDDARKALHLYQFRTGQTLGPFGHNVKTMTVGRRSADDAADALFASTFTGSAYFWTKEIMNAGWHGAPGDFTQVSAGNLDRRSNLDEFATVSDGNVYVYSPKWNVYTKTLDGRNVTAVLVGNFTASPGDEIAMIDADGQVLLCQNKAVEALNQDAQCLAVGRSEGGLDTLYAVSKAGKIMAYDRPSKTWRTLSAQTAPAFSSLVARTDDQGKGHALFAVADGALYRVAPEGKAEKVSAPEPLSRAVLKSAGIPLAAYRWQGVKFKPYVDELRTPAGRNVLRDAPHDHLHHHALMFATWAGGTNFWEEHTPQAGRQQTLEMNIDGASLETKLAWKDAAGKQLLTEIRTIRVATNDNAAVLDWQTVLTAPEDVLVGEKGQGHYHGLGMRFDQSMDKDGVFFSDDENAASENVRGDERLTPCKWMAYTAKLDGKPVTVALFADPKNPAPMLAFTMGDTGKSFAYLSATMNLHRQPITLEAGKSLTFRWRVQVWEGETPRETITQAYGVYAR